MADRERFVRALAPVSSHRRFRVRGHGRETVVLACPESAATLPLCEGEQPDVPPSAGSSITDTATSLRVLLRQRSVTVRDGITIRDGRGRIRTVSRLKAGFTLIEMLVVLAIIGLLVGLVAPRVFNQLAEAKVRTAHIQIESFKNALDLFFLDAGRYPNSNEGLEALITRPSNVASWGGPYIKGTAVPKDPWNNPYLYRSPGQNGRPYDMISAGPGGKGDNGSQIASW